MNWSDLVVLILVIGAAGTEAKRGFGMGLFTLLGAVGAMKLAMAWAGPLSKSIRLDTQAGPNEAILTFFLFILLMALAQVLVYFIHPDTFLNFDPFDNLLGALCGVAWGWVAASLFYSGLITWGAEDLVQTSTLAPEILEFRTYHGIVSGLRHLGVVGKSRYGE